MAYQIDASNVKDPITLTYEERYNNGKDYYGRYIPSAYRSAVATFNTMTAAQYDDWANAADGSVRSVSIPDLDAPTVFATFSTVYIEYMSSDISNGLYFYNSNFRIRHISDLPEFGA